jgi:predicted DNA-binding transcriptional regulator YafY
MRAWCEERKSFRDFTLGRITSIEPVDAPAPYTKKDDVEWNQILELVIVAHPDLSIEQQEMIAAEYFPGTTAKRLRVRQCLASYVIHDLRLAIDPIIQLPPEYQLLVSNADKLPNLFASNF